jgi:hypothetical protein
MDLGNIKKHIDQFMHEQNNRSIAEFEGYSPNEMHNILNFPFESSSPLSLQKLSEADYKKIPMLNQIKYLLNLVRENKEIKLTAKGFLPTKIVKELYDQKYLADEDIEWKISKLYKETDSNTVHLTRILLEIAGITKKRNGKLSLTKNGEILASQDFKLLEVIFTAMAIRFNWGYFDGYENEQIGKVGFAFSLILISRYGATRQHNQFYAEKYFQAFPDLYKTTEPLNSFLSSTERLNNCYSLRTFKRFLEYFGLVRIEKADSTWDTDLFITKTDLFDKLIKVYPHKP